MNTDSNSPQTPITKEFLEKILKRPIISLKTSGGSNPGGNFMSILISLDINVADQDEPLHLLFKTFPSHPTRQKYLEEINLFLKEYQIYDIWIPELISFQKSIIGNDTEKLLIPALPELVAGAAIDYSSGDATNWNDQDPMLSNFLLMIDVRKTYGFKMANKLESHGYQHVKILLDKLAKYHALGHAYKLHKKLPNIRSKYGFMEDPVWTNPKQRQMIETMMEGQFKSDTDICKKFLEEHPEITESISKFKDSKLAADYFELFLGPDGMDEEKVEGWMRVKPEEFSGEPLKEQWIVAGHGDCWSNNMLFKQDENGNVTDAILVDLQLCKESCIMADIVYYIFTSTDTNFRKNYMEEMLKWYFDRFSHYCGVLKVDTFPGFTLHNFRRRFHRSKISGFLFATLCIPLMLQRPETSVNMDSMKVEGNGNDTGEEFTSMIQQTGRDEDDEKLMRDRYSSLLAELYDEGVL